MWYYYIMHLASLSQATTLTTFYVLLVMNFKYLDILISILYAKSSYYNSSGSLLDMIITRYDSKMFLLFSSFSIQVIECSSLW
jgi:hypothetical protein